GGAGPEGLLVDRRRATVDRGEQRRRVEGPRAGRDLAPEYESRAAADRLLDLPVQRVAQVDPGRRAHLGGAVEGIAHPSRPQLVGERADELVGDGLDDDEAL